MNTKYKKATNVTISQDLLKKSKEYKIHLSQTLEKIVVEKEKERWKQENQKAINDYNNSVEQEGVFGDEFRNF